MQKSPQKSLSFVLPKLGFNLTLLFQAGLTNTYMGSTEYITSNE